MKVGKSGFSIGEALEEFDRIHYQQREAERDQPPVTDALDDYAAIVSGSSHPPNECGDPYDCPIHAEQIRTARS